MNQFQKTNTKLDQLRSSFFLLGLIVASSITFLAFEWTTTTHTTVLAGILVEEIEGDFEYIEPFEIEKKVEEVEKIEPPKVKSTEFKIVPDKEPVKEVKDPAKTKAPETGFKEGEWTTPDPEEKEKEFTIVEHMPEFVGGVKELFKFLGKNTKYPKQALHADIEGTVYVRFVVGKTGEVKKVSIIRGVNSLLDKEAIRVIKSMPAWTPGSQHGKKVSVVYQLPIHFKIRH